MSDARDALRAALAARPDVIETVSWGETSFFVNPGAALPRGAYYATIKDRDGPNDAASALHRPGVWRLNLGVGPQAFQALFGPRPARPPKGGVVDGPWDFQALDVLTPHPVYGWMGWVAILAPRDPSSLASLIETAYARASDAAQRRLAKRG